MGRGGGLDCCPSMCRSWGKSLTVFLCVGFRLLVSDRVGSGAGRRRSGERGWSVDGRGGDQALQLRGQEKDGAG